MLRYNTIIIEPDSGVRARLGEALRSCQDFDQVIPSNDFTDVNAAMDRLDRIDVFFISSRLNRYHIKDFIDEVSAKFKTRDASRILLLDTSSQDTSSVASRMLEGLDGFLAEPFSLSSLQDIVQLATEIKKKRSKQREETAINLLLKEILAQVDQIAALKKSGFPANISVKNLNEMCSVLQILEDDVKEKYMEKAVSAFIDAKLPQDITNGDYRGPSQRIMKKKTEKVVALLKDAFIA